DRPPAFREPQEARRSGRCSIACRGDSRSVGRACPAPAGRMVACGAGDADARRTPGDRDHVLRRALARRSRGTARAAAWHHQDTHPVRIAQAAAGVGRRIGKAMNIGDRCEQSVITCAYAVRALSPGELAAAEAHLASCEDCQRELEALRPLLDRFASWPTDVLRPTSALQARLALRLAEETGKPAPAASARRSPEPGWKQVAPGIECKLLATDAERHRVSMLVRLAPGARYPAHTHA